MNINVKRVKIFVTIPLENVEEVRNNVIITPHTAGVSKQAIERMDFELANNIVNCLKDDANE